MKKKERRFIIASLFFMCAFICFPANASNYGIIEERINQNNRILNDSNRMNEIYRQSFTDFSMKEFRETNYKGFDSSQQQKLKSIANTILENNASNLTDLEKLEKFYNFIVDNFYYYQTPEKIPALSRDNKWDNPYYLLTSEYYTNGKVRARSNGFATTLVMLARTQNIPARLVGGYYNKEARESNIDWGSNITNKSVNHVWVLAYIDNSWRMFDPVADSYKKYDDETSTYVDEQVQNASLINNQNVPEESELSEENENNELDSTNYENQLADEEKTMEQPKLYFNPSIEDISKTHIGFYTYATSNNMKYISDYNERNQLSSFLNIKSGNIQNGKRINNLYNSYDSSTWINRNDNSSKTNGYGKVKELYWPSNRYLSGDIRLNHFSELQYFTIKYNNIRSLSLTNVPNLRRINVYSNKLNRIIVTGCNKLVYLRTKENPATYIKYNFNNSNKLATIQASKGGTVSVDYTYKNNINKHYLKAKPQIGYSFAGWYKGKKKVSSKTNYTLKNSNSFTYVAKFKKNPAPVRIKISISKQKLYFYKKGKLVYRAPIVTGQKYEHDTPTGTFKIRGKARNIYLVGDDYRNFVHYWMPIYGDIGLHDAPWRSSFGSTIYKYNGSHGCINLSYKTAKYIYKNAPVGTKVKVVK